MAEEELIDRLKKLDTSMVQNFNNRGNSGRNSREGRGGRGGRNWNNNNNRPQCQICGKLGHVAVYCYFRFDPQAQNVQPNSRNPTAQQALPPPPTFHNPKALIANPNILSD
ncbi:hypothetical protein PIB30_027761 [Stylosanthes scabra]|uniref:CCHC-type domain-containing protein n=1 Tax=Stylosanthes scabra TaxID=79078 RepID=A0ABU6Y7Y1_9FABA|nr:hypothetical protein [Stylosanthes scabra]